MPPNVIISWILHEEKNVNKMIHINDRLSPVVTKRHFPTASWSLNFTLWLFSYCTDCHPNPPSKIVCLMRILLLREP